MIRRLAISGTALLLLLTAAVAAAGTLPPGGTFVDDDGNWDPLCYVPTYLRCYPFTFAVEKSGQLAVVVDRNAPSVSESPQFPFFVNGEVSEHTDALMQLCAQYEQERRRTQEFCKKLVDLDLLVMHQANLRINEAVQQRLGLPDDKVYNNIQSYGNTTAATIPTTSAPQLVHRNARSVRVIVSPASGSVADRATFNEPPSFTF